MNGVVLLKNADRFRDEPDQLSLSDERGLLERDPEDLDSLAWYLDPNRTPRQQATVRSLEGKAG
jgi:hypothetical protein